MTQLALRHFAGTLWKVVKATLMVTGLVTLVVWEVDTFSQPRTVAPAVAQQEASPVFDAIQPARMAAETLAMADPADRSLATQAAEHKRVATYLARKYRVAVDATAEIVGATYRIGKDLGVDPFLILAVMAIESRMNPYAESGMGAVGLMQVIPKYHLDKFEEHGGPEAVLNPLANIRVGAMILKDTMQRFGGLESGLKAYSGATGDDFGYASKVLAERDRLRAAAGLVKVAPAVAVPVRVEARPAPNVLEPSDDDA